MTLPMLLNMIYATKLHVQSRRSDVAFNIPLQSNWRVIWFNHQQMPVSASKGITYILSSLTTTLHELKTRHYYTIYNISQ